MRLFKNVGDVMKAVAVKKSETDQVRMCIYIVGYVLFEQFAQKDFRFLCISHTTSRPGGT